MLNYTIKEIAAITNGVILCGDEQVKIHGFSTGSKECSEGLLFVPVIGERVDGHDYIKDAVLHKAAGFFTMKDKIEEGMEHLPQIHVKDTVRALQKTARHYRNQFNLPIIGVTGSVGKTTVKEMIAAALSGGEASDIILKTSGNMNSQIGLAQMMFKINEKHMIAVIEMGISKEGEMEKLSHIVSPLMTVITNIGVSHIANLGSKENIRKAKMNIINHLKPQGILLLNGDDELLLEVFRYIKDCQKSNEINSLNIDLTDETKKRINDITVYTYGFGNDCDYQALNLNIDNNAAEFTYRCNRSYDNIDEKIVLSVPGRHNVLNALVALAVADLNGSSLENAKEGLHQYKPIAMRGVIETINHITLIDDTYNASTDSMISGIDMLCTLKDMKRKIVILADILELGENSETEHRNVGRYAACKDIDILITIGDASRFISMEAVSMNRQITTMHFHSKKEAEEYIKKQLCAGDVYYMKGSRGMKLDETADLLRSFIKET